MLCVNMFECQGTHTYTYWSVPDFTHILHIWVTTKDPLVHNERSSCDRAQRKINERSSCDRTHTLRYQSKVISDTYTFSKAKDRVCHDENTHLYIKCSVSCDAHTIQICNQVSLFRNSSQQSTPYVTPLYSVFHKKEKAYLTLVFPDSKKKAGQAYWCGQVRDPWELNSNM